MATWTISIEGLKDWVEQGIGGGAVPSWAGQTFTITVSESLATSGGAVLTCTPPTDCAFFDELANSTWGGSVFTPTNNAFITFSLKDINTDKQIWFTLGVSLSSNLSIAGSFNPGGFSFTGWDNSDYSTDSLNISGYPVINFTYNPPPSGPRFPYFNTISPDQCDPNSFRSLYHLCYHF